MDEHCTGPRWPNGATLDPSFHEILNWGNFCNGEVYDVGGDADDDGDVQDDEVVDDDVGDSEDVDHDGRWC